MTFYLIQARVDLNALQRWSALRFNTKSVYDEGHSLHHLLSQSLESQTLQPFRLLYTQGSQYGTLLGYSKHDHVKINGDLALQAAPDVLAMLTDINSKKMPESIAEGKRVGFDIKVRPVKRRRNENNTIVEKDAFLLHINAVGKQVKVSRNEVYTDWLSEKMQACGAQLDRDATTIKAYRRTRVVRSSGQHSDKKPPMIEGPEVVFHGDLTVSDPYKFLNALATGLGRHKAYGFGMLVVRPASVKR